MVPPYSHRVSRVRRYSGYSWLFSLFVYRTLTFFGLLSHTIPLSLNIPFTVRTPRIFLLSVWPPPRSLATTYGISVDVFSSPYLDVSVQAVPHARLFYSPCVDRVLLCRVAPFGYPRLQATIYVLPWLFAVNRVLLRLPVPRHSPCALYSLTFYFSYAILF